MTIDPKLLITLIADSGSQVRLSELDALMARQATVIGGTPEPSDVTAGLGAAMRKGWLESDGLRVSVSRSGRRALMGT